LQAGRLDAGDPGETTKAIADQLKAAVPQMVITRVGSLTSPNLQLRPHAGGLARPLGAGSRLARIYAQRFPEISRAFSRIGSLGKTFCVSPNHRPRMVPSRSTRKNPRRVTVTFMSSNPAYRWLTFRSGKSLRSGYGSLSE